MLTFKNAGRDVLNVFRTSSEIIVLDCETTGFASETDRVIQFSGIKFCILNGIMKEKERFDVYINPMFPIPEKITELTGITDEMLSKAKEENEVFPTICAFLGDNPIVCGQNTRFDLRFINAMFERNNRVFEFQMMLDTLEMAKDLVDAKEVPNRKLETLAKHFGVSHGLSFHNAMDDVIACSRLLRVFSEMYKEREEKGYL